MNTLEEEARRKKKAKQRVKIEISRAYIYSIYIQLLKKKECTQQKIIEGTIPTNIYKTHIYLTFYIHRQCAVKQIIFMMQSWRSRLRAIFSSLVLLPLDEEEEGEGERQGRAC